MSQVAGTAPAWSPRWKSAGYPSQEKTAHQSPPLVPTGQVESAEGPGQAGGSGDGS